MSTETNQPSPLVAIRLQLRAPLPKEAIKQHPTKKYLSTVNVAFIIERLNDVFGEDGWTADYTIVESEKMIVVRCDFSAGNIKRTAFGGNENSDRGDSYKGACTDALSKAASQIGIAGDVYKGLHDAPAGQIQVSGGQATVSKPATKPAAKPVQKVDKATEFPHGANQGNLPLPENNLPAKTFVANDSDVPDNIGSPKPVKPTIQEFEAYGKLLDEYKVVRKTFGDYLKRRFNVAKPKDDLTKADWEQVMANLKLAHENGSLDKLLAA